MWNREGSVVICVWLALPMAQGHLQCVSQACPTCSPSHAEAVMHRHHPRVPLERWKWVFKTWFRVDTSPHCGDRNGHTGLGQCCSQHVPLLCLGLHNFRLCWLTHILKELRGLFDSGLSITKYYFPMHLWSYPIFKFQPRKVRDVWRLWKKFWTAKMRGKSHGSKSCAYSACPSYNFLIFHDCSHESI